VKAPKTTKSGEGSTDVDSLEQLKLPELEKLLQVRKLKKVRDTYLDAFYRESVDGVMHPFFNLHTVKTFRSSSSNPNFQNIPKRDEEAMKIIRNAIFPRKGHQLLEIDFSGLEVCIAACYHKDPVMLKYINDPTTDMHSDMASQIFKVQSFNKNEPTHGVLRQAAKNGFVFPQFYGYYYKNCAENMAVKWGQLPQTKWKPGQGVPFEKEHLSDHLIKVGFPSYNSFLDYIQVIEKDFWTKRFRVYAKWKEQWYEKYKKNGYVDLLTGFRCSGIMSKNDVTNYPVQGAAFHCLLWSLIEATDALTEMDTKVIGQIHDSMILDVNPSELSSVITLLKYITCEALPKQFSWINVPLNVDAELCPVDASWAKKEKYKI